MTALPRYWGAFTGPMGRRFEIMVVALNREEAEASCWNRLSGALGGDDDLVNEWTLQNLEYLGKGRP